VNSKAQKGINTRKKDKGRRIEGIKREMTKLLGLRFSRK
jgi:hypothetical protein